MFTEIGSRVSRSVWDSAPRSDPKPPRPEPEPIRKSEHPHPLHIQVTTYCFVIIWYKELRQLCASEGDEGNPANVSINFADG
jgi:hypothetical protein